MEEAWSIEYLDSMDKMNTVMLDKHGNFLYATGVDAIGASFVDNELRLSQIKKQTMISHEGHVAVQGYHVGSLQFDTHFEALAYLQTVHQEKQFPLLLKMMLEAVPKSQAIRDSIPFKLGVQLERR